MNPLVKSLIERLEARTRIGYMANCKCGKCHCVEFDDLKLAIAFLSATGNIDRQRLEQIGQLQNTIQAYQEKAPEATDPAVNNRHTEQTARIKDALERVALLDEADGHLLTVSHAFQAVAIATSTLGKHPSEIYADRLQEPKRTTDVSVSPEVQALLDELMAKEGITKEEALRRAAACLRKYRSPTP